MNINYKSKLFINYEEYKIKIKYERNADNKIFFYYYARKRKLCECHTRFFFVCFVIE